MSNTTAQLKLHALDKGEQLVVYGIFDQLTEIDARDGRENLKLAIELWLEQAEKG